MWSNEGGDAGGARQAASNDAVAAEAPDADNTEAGAGAGAAWPGVRGEGSRALVVGTAAKPVADGNGPRAVKNGAGGGKGCGAGVKEGLGYGWWDWKPPGGRRV